MCIYISERWCTDVTLLKKMCCSDLEMLSTQPLTPPATHLSPTPALKISEDEVRQVFTESKRRKVPEPDGVTPVCLKSCADQLAAGKKVYKFSSNSHSLGKFSSSTGAPQGCVLSTLLFSLYTNDCTSKDPSVKLLKFADDTTLIGLIQVTSLLTDRRLRSWLSGSVLTT